MVVIGIDFGSDSCVVSLWKNNRVETILNDYFERKTPSYVAFSENKRQIGVAALNQQASNVTSTIFGFKNEIGSSSDIDTASTNVFGLLDIIKAGNGSLSYEVKYQNQIHECRPEIAASMLLSKLSADASKFSQTSLTGCLIAVPSYFTDKQQKDLLLAAGIAGLNCFNLIKETTSIAVNYAFNKKFPTPLNVIFVDFGRSSIQVSACCFSERVIKMIAEVSDIIGGWDIDKLLAKHFIKSLGISADENKSFCVGLLSEVEKLKRKVGLVDNKLPLCIEHLLDIKDQPTLQRSEMEEICQPIFDTVEGVLRKILVDSKLSLDDIHSIEIVGGSTRIPKVKELIEKVFGQRPRMTMNQDEAISKGCLLSWVNMRQRDPFEIIDIPTPRGSYEQNDCMRIRDVHLNYIPSDRDDCLFATREDFEMFRQEELNLIEADEREKQRSVVRNKLDEYMNAVKDDASFLQLVGQEYFDGIKYWHQGTTEEYQEKIFEIEQLVEKSHQTPQTDSKLDDQNSTAPPPLEETISEATSEEISTEISLVDNPTIEEPREEVVEKIPEVPLNPTVEPYHRVTKNVTIDEPQVEAPIPKMLPDYKRKALHQGSEFMPLNYNTVHVPKPQRGVVTDTQINLMKKNSAPVKMLPQQRNGILDKALVEKWRKKNWITEQTNSQSKIDDVRQHIGKAIYKIQHSQVDSINKNLIKTIIEQQIREALSANTDHETFNAYDKLLKLLQVAVDCLSWFCAQEVNKISARSTAV